MKYGDMQLSVEKEREEKDEIYKIMFNENLNYLNKYVISIQKLVLEKYTTSPRIEKCFSLILQSHNRAVKHALVFFAIYQEESLVNHFINSLDMKNLSTEKFSNFVNDVLRELVEKLLKGQFTSLQDFVENCRHQYITL